MEAVIRACELKVVSEIDQSNRFCTRAEDDSTLKRCETPSRTAGVLDLRMGGPGFYSNISAQALKDCLENPRSESLTEAEQNRRSLYQFMKRGLLPPMMRTFDLCESNQSVGNRNLRPFPPKP